MTDRDELVRERCNTCGGSCVHKEFDYDGYVLWVRDCTACNGTGWTAREARENQHIGTDAVNPKP